MQVADHERSQQRHRYDHLKHKSGRARGRPKIESDRQGAPYQRAGRQARADTQRQHPQRSDQREQHDEKFVERENRQVEIQPGPEPAMARRFEVRQVRSEGGYDKVERRAGEKAAHASQRDHRRDQDRDQEQRLAPVHQTRTWSRTRAPARATVRPTIASATSMKSAVISAVSPLARLRPTATPSAAATRRPGSSTSCEKQRQREHGEGQRGHHAIGGARKIGDAGREHEQRRKGHRAGAAKLAAHRKARRDQQQPAHAKTSRAPKSPAPTAANTAASQQMNPREMGSRGRPAAQQRQFRERMPRFGGIQRARAEHHEPARERYHADRRPSEMLRRDNAQRPFQPLSRVIAGRVGFLGSFRASWPPGSTPSRHSSVSLPLAVIW